MPISIELEPTVFSGNSNCNIPIYLNPFNPQNIEAVINPQPATDVVQIQFNQPIKIDFDIEIYNSLGVLMSSQNAFLNNEDNIKLHLENYESGIYFLLIKSSNLFIKKRLMIVR